MDQRRICRFCNLNRLPEYQTECPRCNRPLTWANVIPAEIPGAVTGSQMIDIGKRNQAIIDLEFGKGDR